MIDASCQLQQLATVSSRDVYRIESLLDAMYLSLEDTKTFSISIDILYQYQAISCRLEQPLAGGCLGGPLRE